MAVFLQGAVAQVQQEGRLADLIPGGNPVLPAAGAAEQRIYPGGEFRRGKGLGHIVVRSGHQSGNLVHLLGAGGEHDNADLVVHGPDTAADLEAVDPRQHHIQQRHLHVRLFFQLFQGLFPCAGLHSLIAGALQVNDHKAADVLLILQHKHFFGHILISFVSRSDGTVPAGRPHPGRSPSCCTAG